MASDARWSPGDGALPPSRCRMRGCIFPPEPGKSGWCHEHAETDAPPGRDTRRALSGGYRYRGEIRDLTGAQRETARNGVAAPVAAGVNVLAAQWAAPGCEFGGLPVYSQ